MGAKDTVTVKLLRKNHIFADVFNYFLYDGEERIDPNALMEMDTREISVPFGGAERAKLPVQRTRDVLKTVVSMTDKRTAYRILGIEAQSDIHYAMPVRDMVYTSLNYAQQVEKAAESHRLSGDFKGASSEEYLSGFMRNDRLLPVVTIIIYFGSSKWDGPTSIHEMLSMRDINRELLAYIPDYRINLMEPATMDESDFSKLHSELRTVLMAIKASGDKEAMNKMLQSGDFLKLERDGIDVVNACTNAKLTIENQQEVVNVRDAWDEIREEAAEAKAELKAAQAEAEADREKAEAALAEAKAEAEAAQERFLKLKDLLESILGDYPEHIEGGINPSSSKERDALMNLLKFVE